METSLSISYQLQQLLEFLITPVGILALLAVPCFLGATLSSKAARWIGLGLLLYISTYGVKPPEMFWKPVLMTPFQQLRNMGKPLGLVIVALMLPAALFAAVGPRSRRPAAAAFAYFLFLIFLSLRLMAAGLLTRGISMAWTYVLSFLLFGVGMSRWIQEPDDGRRALKCITWAAVLLMAGTLIQVAVDSRQVINVGRLYGTTSNPQFLGSIMGLSIPPTLFLLTESRESKLWRLVLAGAVGLMLVCVVWSGSRTAALITVVGVLLFFRLKLGRMFVGITIAAVSLWVGAQLFSDSFSGAERLISTEDTRSRAWSRQISQFMSSPIAGVVGEEGFSPQENAHFAVAAQFGMFGLIPWTVVVLLIFRQLVQLTRVRSRLGKRDAALSDVIVSGIVAQGVASIFDAYALGTISFHVFHFYIYVAIANMLVETARSGSPLTTPSMSDDEYSNATGERAAVDVPPGRYPVVGVTDTFHY